MRTDLKMLLDLHSDLWNLSLSALFQLAQLNVLWSERIQPPFICTNVSGAGQRTSSASAEQVGVGIVLLYLYGLLHLD